MTRAVVRTRAAVAAARREQAGAVAEPTNEPPAGLATGRSRVRHVALKSCGRVVILQYSDDATGALLTAGFSGLIGSFALPSPGSVVYRIDRCPNGRGFVVADSTGRSVSLDDEGHLLFHLDKQVTLALQYQRSDLYFLHAAVLVRADSAVVFLAPSGVGKSTLALALLERGFDYSSDELAPVHVPTLTVHPYARALILKSPPPHPCVLPPGAVRTGQRYCVPVDALRGSTRAEPAPLAAVFVLRRPHRGGLVCRPLSPALAAANLVSSALNSGAHANDALDAALTVSRAVPCFELAGDDIDAACSAVDRILSSLPNGDDRRASATTAI